MTSTGVLHSITDFAGNILLEGNLNCSILDKKTYDAGIVVNWCYEPEYRLCGVRTEIFDLTGEKGFGCPGIRDCSNTGGNLEFCSEKEVGLIVMFSFIGILFGSLLLLLCCTICEPLIPFRSGQGSSNSSPPASHYLDRYWSELNRIMREQQIRTSWYGDVEQSVLSEECSVCLDMGDGKEICKCNRCEKLFHKDCVENQRICPLCRFGEIGSSPNHFGPSHVR